MYKKKEKLNVSDEKTFEIREHEDASLKVAAQYFGDVMLPYFGIEGEIVSYGPTEIVHLEARKMYEDFNFIMKDGRWIHFEFQSTNEGVIGLKRFRVYEADTSYQYNTEVYTYVLFSGKIRNPMTEFTEGFNTYRMTRDALMVDEQEIKKMQAVIYVMADKFLEGLDLEEFKEDAKMTKLGQMIMEDGRKEERDNGIFILISTCKELGITKETVITSVIGGYKVSREEAEEHVEKYW